MDLNLSLKKLSIYSLHYLKFENDVKRLYIRHSGWRQNAENIIKRYLDEGLRDRAVTRDFNWGVDVPLEGYEDKKNIRLD